MGSASKLKFAERDAPLEQVVTETRELCRDAAQEPELQAAASLFKRRNIQARSLLLTVHDLHTQANVVECARVSEAEGIPPGQLERSLLLYAGMEFLLRIGELRVVDAVKRNICKEFRFVAQPAAGYREYYTAGTEEFASMAKTVTLRRFPAGQFDWEPLALYWSWILRVPNVPQLLYFVTTKLRKTRPVLFIHMGRHRKGRLVLLEKEVNRAYFRMAKSLELQPEVAGIISAGWFYAPEIDKVSPHLAWLPKFFRDNGGFVTSLGAMRDARMLAEVFERSAERKQDFDSGKFSPQHGLIVWPRKAALRWADANPQFQ